MASITLYPPILPTNLPAFVGVGRTVTIGLRIPIEYSQLNQGVPATAHVTIKRKSNSVNCSFMSNGIILNKTIYEDDDGKYITLTQNDFYDGGQQKWVVGESYKIQVRLSSIAFDTVSWNQIRLWGVRKDFSTIDTYTMQRYGIMYNPLVWLNENSTSFSEWSNICVIKITDQPRLIFQNIGENGYDTKEDTKPANTWITNFEIFGRYINTDSKEILKSYQFTLYDEGIWNNSAISKKDKPVLDDSGVITVESDNFNSFKYRANYEGVNQHEYHLNFTYTTINNYTSSIDFKLTVVRTFLPASDLTIDTIETKPEVFEGKMGLGEEEEEGVVTLAIRAVDEGAFSGNLCIRRSSSKNDFTTWEDIAIFYLDNTNLDKYLYWQDQFIESGIWYKYGVQTIDADYNRSALTEMTQPVIRELEYSYLLGPDGVQLKLPFNTTINSISRNLTDQKQTMIGSKYPYITRTSEIDYRSFQLSSLITRWADEQEFFTNARELYSNPQSLSIVALYEDHNAERNAVANDYTYERLFRDKVNNFLHNTDVKLFRSPTEGNILVRITDSSITPNSNLGRMLYTFSSTLNEIDEATYPNYQKYGLYSVGEPKPLQEKIIYLIGQTFVNNGENIISKIYEKASTIGAPAGYQPQINYITDLKIVYPETALDKGLYYNNLIFDTDSSPIYYFGKQINLYGTESVTPYYRMTREGQTDLPIEANYIISVSYIPQPTRHSSKSYTNILAGIAKVWKPNQDLLAEAKAKYHIDWETKYRNLVNITSVVIGANPGTLFLIKEQNELVGEEHYIGETGILDLTRYTNIDSIILKNTKETYVSIQFVGTLQIGTYDG